MFKRLSLFLKLEKKIRTTISTFLPHHYYVFFYSLGRKFVLNQLAKIDLKFLKSTPVINYPVKFNDLIFRNDLGNAAGFDKDGELLAFNYCLGAGFAVVGTVLATPHVGNLFRFGPWQTNIWTPLPHSHSAINSLGLPSKGIDIALKNITAFKHHYRPHRFPVGISLMAHPTAHPEQQIIGVKDCIQKSAAIVDFIELNESCPNVREKKKNDDLYERLLQYTTCRNRYAPHVPLMIKVKNTGGQNLLLKIVQELNIAGLVCFNTQTNYSELQKKITPADKSLFNHYTQKYQGGVSGKIIYEQNLKSLKQIKKKSAAMKTNIRLVHVGGIDSFDNIKESRKVACLRQWYTGLMDKISQQKITNVYASVLENKN